MNGAAMWARGANVVPTEVLEGRDTPNGSNNWWRARPRPASIRYASGAAAFSYRAFYDAATSVVSSSTTTSCSRSGHAPRGTVIERNEIRHQVRRLSSHACLFRAAATSARI